MATGDGESERHAVHAQGIAERIQAEGYRVDVDAVATALAERLLAGRALAVRAPAERDRPRRP
jgi:hypothetical protein